jgi:hypothetical protein
LTGITVSNATQWNTMQVTTASIADNNLLRYDSGTGKWVLVSSGTAGSFLRNDMTWNAPAGGGDMLKSIYDTNDDGEVNSTFVSSMTFSSHTLTTGMATFNGGITMVQTTTYLSIAPSSFICNYSSHEVRCSRTELVTMTAGTTYTFYTPINLSNNSVVTNLRSWWLKGNAASSGEASLFRANSVASHSTMATTTLPAATGTQLLDNSTITNATIDNSTYTYGIEIKMLGDTSYDNVQLRGCIITYTITSPVP